ncbi:hypothetical protein D3C73_1493390 [compost metagenome]
MCGYRHHFRDVLNHMTKFVFTHQPRAGFAHQLAIEAFLYPFNTLAINIGEANQIRGNVTGGIETTGLFAKINPRKIQIINPLRLLG